jgi:hypothetical protein
MNEPIMYVYINTKLRKVIKGTKNIYIIDLKEGDTVDYFLKNQDEFYDMDIFEKGKYQFYISLSGHPHLKKLGN